MCAVQNLANTATWRPEFLHLWAYLKYCPSIHVSKMRKIHDKPQSRQQISVCRDISPISLNTNQCDVP